MAGRFRFRLEVVRRVRRQAQDVQRRNVAEAIRAVAIAEQRVEDLHGALDRAIRQAQVERRDGPLDPVSLTGFQLVRVRIERDLATSRGELIAGEGALDRERAKLAELTKRLKVIEKLRERQQARHDEETRREEQRVADEQSTQAYLRERHVANSVGALT